MGRRIDAYEVTNLDTGAFRLIFYPTKSGDATLSIPSLFGANETASVLVQPGTVASVNLKCAPTALYGTVGDVSRLILAEHDGRADVWGPGFAAAANGGLYDGPILLTDGLSVPPETLAYILDGLQDNLVNLGGAPVICTSFVNLLPCELIALLMLGSVAEVEAIIGDLPVISDVLDVIGLGGDDEDPEGDPEDPEGDPEDPEGDPEGEGMFCDPIFGTGLCLDDLLPVT